MTYPSLRHAYWRVLGPLEERQYAPDADLALLSVHAGLEAVVDDICQRAVAP